MTRAIKGIGALVLATAGATGAVLAAPSAAEAQAEPCVQRIAVVNNAGFVASFQVVTSQGLQSQSTDQYPINQWRTIDLTTTPLPAGSDVRPLVHAVAGNDATPSDYVSYCANGQTATYSVTGTTTNITVTLIR